MTYPFACLNMIGRFGSRRLQVMSAAAAFMAAVNGVTTRRTTISERGRMQNFHAVVFGESG